jgi:hypothetical membrane protein
MKAPINTSITPHHAAGILILAACIIAFMGIITAETTYPSYSTKENTISDLGSSLPPDPIILQPAATIFNVSMVVAGILLAAGGCLLVRAGFSRLFSLLFTAFGAGVLGVGVFNGSYAGPHTLFAMMTFTCGGCSAVVSYRIIKTPLRYPSLALGMTALTMLLFYSVFGLVGPLSTLGIGGVERWVAYPIILWACAFSGYLLSPGPSSTESAGA